jgi:hypothetical protein
MQQRLADAQRKSRDKAADPAGETGPDDASDEDDLAQRWLAARTDALRQRVGDIAQRLSPFETADEAGQEEVRAILLQFLDAYFEPRIREVLGLAEEWLSRAGRAAVGDALAD